jgi:hypothetical protein
LDSYLSTKGDASTGFWDSPCLLPPPEARPRQQEIPRAAQENQDSFLALNPEMEQSPELCKIIVFLHI